MLSNEPLSDLPEGFFDFLEEDMIDPGAQKLAHLREFRDSEKGKNLVKWVLHQYHQMDNARSKEKQQWLINLAMYNRMHDVNVTGGGSLPPGQLYDMGLSRPKRKKKMVNRIRAAVRTEISKFLSQKPSSQVMPATNTDEDLAASKAAEAALKSVLSRRKFNVEYARCAFWLSITGNGFMKCYWDQGVKDSDSRLPGDIVFTSVNPFNFFVADPREEEIERQPYVLEMYTRPLAQIKMDFKAELEGIDIKPSVTQSDSLLSEAYLKTSSAADKPLDSCMVYEMWIKPGRCDLLPEGGLVTLVDQVMVGISEGLPFNHGEFPYAHVKHVPTGKFYGASIIEDLIDLQLEYNANVTLVADARKKMGKPQLTAQKGSIVTSKMTDEIGLIIEYKPGTPPPAPLPLAQLPSYIFQEQERILADIEDISGQHQVSKGSAPAGVTAATAISFLQEKDDSFIVPTLNSVEAMTEKIGRMVLELIVQFWDVPRTVKTIGEDRAFDAQQFMGSDLANATDLRVEPGSGAPESPAARRATLMDLMTMGLLDPTKGLPMLGVGGIDKAIESSEIDKHQAARENIRMKSLEPADFEAHQTNWDAQVSQMGIQTDPATGQPFEAPLVIPVNDFDNHEVHIEVHNNFRKSQEFDTLPVEIQELFEAHVELHERMMQQNMLKQMLSQIPTDGSVPGMQAPAAEGEEGEEEEMAPGATSADAPPSEAEEVETQEGL